MSSSAPRASNIEGLLSAVMLAILGGVIGTSDLTPVKSQRSNQKAAVAVQVPAPGVVVARAWEDPIGAASAALEASKPAPAPAQPSGAKPGAAIDHTSAWPRVSDVGSTTSDVASVRLLGLVMGDEATQEAEEQRRLDRNAVHASLAAQEYRALNSGAVRFFPTPILSAPSAGTVLTGLNRVIAYEWYYKQRPVTKRLDTVLVLYAGNGAMHQASPAGPSLVGTFGLLARKVLNESGFKPDASDGAIRATLITNNTGLLLTCAAEVARQPSIAHQRHEYTIDLSESLGFDFTIPVTTFIAIDVLDTGSTADLFDVGLIRKQSAPDAETTVAADETDDVLQAWAEQVSLLNAPAGPTRDLLTSRDGLRSLAPQAVEQARDMPVTRILGSDREIAAAMAREISLRGIDLTNPRNSIVCLHERDTEYGAAFAKSLLEACDNRARGKIRANKGEGAIYDTISFESIIDGSPLATARDEDTPQRAVSASDSAKAFGKPQLDYLYRALRDRSLASTPARPKLRAVVIVATDTFDKRPLIQLVRREFPDVLVLTNDMHAIFEDPTDYITMRNLVVASHLGLTPPRVALPNTAADHREPAPPAFRSMYQTSLYLGVIQAVSGVKVQPAPPQIYEVGRRRAFPLATTSSSPAVPLSTSTRWIWLAWGFGLLVFAAVLTRLRRELNELSLWRRWVLWIVVAGSCCFGAIHFASTRYNIDSPRLVWSIIGVFVGATGLAGLLAVGIWNHSRRPGEGAVARKEWHEIHKHGFGMLYVTLILGTFFALLVVNGSGPDGEPFALWDGISAWPSEGLRLVVIVLGTTFFIAVLRTFRDTKRPEGCPDSLRTPDSSWLTRRGIVGWTAPLWKARAVPAPTTDFVDPEILNQEFSFKARPAAKICRVLMTSVAFAALAIGAFLIDDPPITPHRGHLARAVYWIFFIGSAVVLNLVIFAVWDAARLCDRYIGNLSFGVSRWSDQRLAQASLKHGLPRRFLGSLLDIEDIADKTDRFSRLIYYPVILILISGLAWHSGFDNWRWSWQLVLIFGVNIIVAAVAAQTVRRSAEAARRDELGRLDAHARRDIDAHHFDPDKLVPDRFVIEYGPSRAKPYIEEIRAFVTGQGQAPGATPPAGETEAAVSNHSVLAIAAELEKSTNLPRPDADRYGDFDLTNQVVEIRHTADTLGAPAVSARLGTVEASPQERALIAASLYKLVQADRLDPSAEAQSEMIDRLKAHITDIRTGAFSPWTENPVVRSIVLPVVGYGSVKLVDLLQGIIG